MTSRSVNPNLLPKDDRMLPTEAQEQAALFGWAQMKSYFHPELGLMFHIPNGGKRSKAEAARFKAEGVKAGVPDILLPVPRGKYHGLFIELKRLRGGSPTKDQLEWIAQLRAQGYAAAICCGWQEASEEILKYLELERR